MITSKILAIIAAYSVSAISLLGYLLFVYLTDKRLRKIHSTLLASSHLKKS